MRTVFNNRGVVAAWIEAFREGRTAARGRNAKKSLFFEGPILYSYGYHHPLAQLYRTREGVACACVNPSWPSKTTCRHRSLAFAGLRTFTLNVVDARPGTVAWDYSPVA
jgi:hypothetical protein